MVECVILVGLPGAGKTTFYQQRLSKTHLHISKDLFPSSARNKQTRQDAALRAALSSGRSAVVDNTNVSAAERHAIIAIAHALGARVVGIYIVASTREAVGRNERRGGRERVPKVAIFTKAKHLEPPQMAEGFDELRAYRVTEGGVFEQVPLTPPGPTPIAS
jgi:predicted kinase